MVYLIFIVAFALACAAGVQFYYLLFLQAAIRQRNRRIRDLEQELERAQRELAEIRRELELTARRLKEKEAARQRQNDLWPEIIDG
jgi:Tfp pilus assembly protein PilN